MNQASNQWGEEDECEEDIRWQQPAARRTRSKEIEMRDLIRLLLLRQRTRVGASFGASPFNRQLHDTPADQSIAPPHPSPTSYSLLPFALVCLSFFQCSVSCRFLVFLLSCRWSVGVTSADEGHHLHPSSSACSRQQHLLLRHSIRFNSTPSLTPPSIHLRPLMTALQNRVETSKSSAAAQL